MRIEQQLPEPVFKKNDRNARMFIWAVSVFVFIGIAFLTQIKVEANVGFNTHVFATLNAIINSIVAILLLAAILAVKSNNYGLHKKLMLTAIILSVLFLI